jgi:osmotically-inducible protein OsmY
MAGKLISLDRHNGVVTDRQVKATVVSRLRENPYTQDAHIRVGVHHGIVHLEGEVPTPHVRSVVAEDVEAVPGVVDVEVELTVAA